MIIKLKERKRKKRKKGGGGGGGEEEINAEYWKPAFGFILYNRLYTNIEILQIKRVCKWVSECADTQVHSFPLVMSILCSLCDICIYLDFTVISFCNKTRMYTWIPFIVQVKKQKMCVCVFSNYAPVDFVNEKYC